MSFAKKILLFGATGNIGSFILDAILSERSRFGRVVIFTSPQTAETKDENAVKGAYEGIDTVISALGRNTLAQQIPLIRLAAASPTVKWFLPSEYGTDIRYGPASANEKPHQLKLTVRAYLENEISRDDLAYSYVVTGPFAEMYLHLVPGWEEAGGWDVKGRRAVLLGEKGKGEVSLTTMKDVGTLVLNTLLHATAETRNAALCVNSFTTSPDQIQAEFERQLDGQPWDVSRTSLKNLREAEAAAWEAGNPAATVLTLRRIWGEGGTLYTKRANGLIEEPKVMGLEDVVANEIQRVSKS
ncbi:Isoflavone reductase family protein [Penicillium digitatum]|uniref:Isoflavone reductase family protein n=1 Tax=Penicillium digitatum TaxID=36651 RepID=A0A7T6XI45_PENDI|nr:Isoflavone reductase family protein [Penicillium digitatum]